MAELAMEAHLSPYVGQDLDPSKQQIRLMKLHPGSTNAPLVCSSWVASLTEEPRYTALSYVWGDAADQQAITFNHKTSFLVTRSLYIALQYLRDKEVARTLWIDAVCVNQGNEDEKSHQVQLMGAIYRNAAETCIWLGKESADSDLAMRVIRQLDGNDLGSPNNSPDPSSLQAISALQKRAWWGRVWIIQEALLSPNPIIHCGHSTLPMEAFMTLDDIRRGWHRSSGRYLRTPNRITQFSRNLRNPFATIITDWPDLRAELLRPGRDDGANASRLSYWTQSLEEFHATDPRDKIYGLLGLATNADREHMGVALEQRMTASEVYTHATSLFIRTTGSLIFLSFDVDNKAPCPQGEEGKTLPSWVPDYSHRPLDGLASDGGPWFRPEYMSFYKPDPFKATGDGSVLSGSIRTDPFPPDSVAGQLFLRGLVVDEIVFASASPHIRPYDGIDSEQRTRYSAERLRLTAANVLMWEQEAMRPGLADPYAYFPGSSLGETRQQAFRRALLANRNDAGLLLDYHRSEWDERFDVLLGRREMPHKKSNDSDNSSTPGKLQTEMETLLQYLFPLRFALNSTTTGKGFFITARGYLGLGPLNSKPGDEVCVLEGAPVPYVLRSAGNLHGMTTDKQRHFTLVGEAYVHGVSDGEWIVGRSEADIVEVVLV